MSLKAFKHQWSRKVLFQEVTPNCRRQVDKRFYAELNRKLWTLLLTLIFLVFTNRHRLVLTVLECFNWF